MRQPIDHPLFVDAVRVDAPKGLLERCGLRGVPFEPGDSSLVGDDVVLDRPGTYEGQLAFVSCKPDEVEDHRLRDIGPAPAAEYELDRPPVVVAVFATTTGAIGPPPGLCDLSRR